MIQKASHFPESLEIHYVLITFGDMDMMTSNSIRELAIGKSPIGKFPIGNSPIGESPIAYCPIANRDNFAHETVPKPFVFLGFLPSDLKMGPFLVH